MIAEATHPNPSRITSMVTLDHFNRLVICCVAKSEAQMIAARFLFELVQVEEGIRSGRGYDFVRKYAATEKLDELLLDNALPYSELFCLMAKLDAIYQTKLDYGPDDSFDIEDEDEREEYDEFQQLTHQPRGWHDNILFDPENGQWAEQLASFEV